MPSPVVRVFLPMIAIAALAAGATGRGCISPGPGKLDAALRDGRAADAPPPLRDTAPPPDAPGCPRFGPPVAAATLADAALTETSGVAASRAQPGILWLHNDSGDRARLFAVDAATGKTRGEYALSGARAVDWEDIALGPGRAAGTTDLYVADIGDNLLRRAEVVVYRVAEPRVPATGTRVTVTLRGVQALRLAYPGGKAHNAETLLVHPRSGDLYVVTKVPGGASEVYRAAAPLDASRVTTLTRVAAVNLRAAGAPTGLATGGDFTPSGDAILIRAYFAAFAWMVRPGDTVAAALGRPPCALPLAIERQGEAIGAGPAGGYVTVSEGRGATIYRYRPAP